MVRGIERRTADVLVVGGGAAGVTAALAARQGGASVVLLERGLSVGGELIGGLPYLGTHNALGEPIVGGPLQTLLDECRRLGGYVGHGFDGRLMWGTFVDPETMKLAVVSALASSGVRVLPGCFVHEVLVGDGRVHGVIAATKSGPVLFSGEVVIEASGDADVVAGAGGEFWKGDESGVLQPTSLTFRMSGVDFAGLLAFIRDNHGELTLAENPVIGKPPEECARGIHESGVPFAMMQAERPGSLLRKAIEAGDMYQTTGIWMWPTSTPRAEIGLNTTRAAGVDGTDVFSMADALVELTSQVPQAVAFLRSSVPGFGDAQLAGIAPKVGIRETRRIVGDVVLSSADVVAGVKRQDGVAKGAHHVDLHGAGTYQKRVPVEGGRSYDIAYGALVPARLDNVLVAGRCLSSEREANGSARVIGTAAAMGQAAGTAAALTVAQKLESVREVSVSELRSVITGAGGVVDGTN